MASADHGVGTRRAHIADAIAAADAARRPRRAGAFYSHFVAFLKLLLPMIAAALMLIVIIWPEITSRDEGFRIGVADISVEDAKNLRMVNPRYMNIDKVGQPYVLSADETTQATGDDQLVRLKRPKADITLKDGTWIALNADFGNFYRTDKLLDLFGSVNLYQDQGYEFHTTRARFDLTKGHASGQEAVQGQGPFGTVESQGFRILNNGKSILFTGRSHMVILPGAGKRGILRQDSDQPLEIDADRGIEWNKSKKIYAARGNGRAAQGEVTVYADTLIAHYREKPRGGTEIWRLDADGNVRVASPSETAYGDRGVYDIDRGILVLKGRRLRLESTDGQVTARDSLEYWEGRRMAVARGAAYAREGQNQIWADILSVYLHEDAQGKTVMQRVEAFDKVRIETPQDVVVGDLGLYNLDSRTAILCRGVTIVRGDDRLSGQVAEVNLATGRARLRPGRCAFTVK